MCAYSLIRVALLNVINGTFHRWFLIIVEVQQLVYNFSRTATFTEHIFQITYTTIISSHHGWFYRNRKMWFCCFAKKIGQVSWKFFNIWSTVLIYQIKWKGLLKYFQHSFNQRWTTPKNILCYRQPWQFHTTKIIQLTIDNMNSQYTRSLLYSGLINWKFSPRDIRCVASRQ